MNALTIFEMIHLVVLFFFTLTKKEIKLFKTVVTRVKTLNFELTSLHVYKQCLQNKSIGHTFQLVSDSDISQNFTAYLCRVWVKVTKMYQICH